MALGCVVVMWSGVYSDCAVGFPSSGIDHVFPIEVIAEIRPILGAEGIFIRECTVVIEAPWATAFYLDQFNGIERTVSVAIVPGILPRTQHHRALVWLRRNCKIEIVRQGCAAKLHSEMARRL